MKVLLTFITQTQGLTRGLQQKTLVIYQKEVIFITQMQEYYLKLTQQVLMS